MSKSPFLVYQNFLTTEECSIIRKQVSLAYDINSEGIQLPISRNHEDAEKVIFDKFQELIPEISETYGLEYKATESMSFMQYPPLSNGKLTEDPHCDNAA